MTMMHLDMALMTMVLSTFLKGCYNKTCNYLCSYLAYRCKNGLIDCHFHVHFHGCQMVFVFIHKVMLRSYVFKGKVFYWRGLCSKKWVSATC